MARSGAGFTLVALTAAGNLYEHQVRLVRASLAFFKRAAFCGPALPSTASDFCTGTHHFKLRLKAAIASADHIDHFLVGELVGILMVR